MAGKLDFDDTRDAIGVGGLSDAERKNMLKPSKMLVARFSKKVLKDPTGSDDDDSKSGSGKGSWKRHTLC